MINWITTGMIVTGIALAAYGMYRVGRATKRINELENKDD
jgi:hypothetical protein